MSSPIKKSRPLKKFRVHRNKNGAVLVTAKVQAKDRSFGPGDHILGFSSDEDIVVQHLEGLEDHGIMASYFNMLDHHISGGMTDEQFARGCADLMGRRVRAFLEGWAIFEKAGDLPKHTKADLKRHAHAEKLHKRLRRK